MSESTSRISKEELVNEICKIRSDTKPIFVAISGFGGSGKSTLATFVAKSIKDAVIIPVDDFIIGERTQTSSDWSTFDRYRLRNDVIVKAECDKALRYKKFNSGEWASGSKGSWREVLIGKYIIIEGCGIIHPTLLPYYDYSAWIDCPQTSALQSAKQRDRSETELFANENTDRLWDEVWGPNDKAFFDKFKPNKLVDTLVEEQL